MSDLFIAMNKKIFCFMLLSFTSNIIFCQSNNTIGVIKKENNAYPGLILFAPNESNTTYLINNCGELVNKWESNYKPGSSVYLREDGFLVRTIKNSNPNFTNPKGPGGGVEVYNWSGELIWSFDYNTQQNLQHHDISLLPNGNILLLAWEIHAFDESIANGRNPDFLSENEVWSEHIVEIDPTLPESENIVWSWYLWDHLIQDFDVDKMNYAAISSHPELVNLNYTEATTDGDWVHANSIDYNSDLDQIIISSRNLNEFWVIDHGTTTEEAASHSGGNSNKGGDILYRWGNPSVYGNGTSSDQTLFGQHDVHWIPSDLQDGGKIMVFNNGFKRTEGAFSSVDIIEPPLNGFNYTLDGSVFGPQNNSWSYTAETPTDFYSFFMWKSVV